MRCSVTDVVLNRVTVSDKIDNKVWIDNHAIISVVKKVYMATT
jgi:hypothetical protein